MTCPAITHFFVGTEYAKLTRIEPGQTMTQHVHRFSHASMLLVGSVTVAAGMERATYTAPAMLTIPAGVAHSVTALTPALWACLWANPTGQTDPHQMDETLIA